MTITAETDPCRAGVGVTLKTHVAVISMPETFAVKEGGAGSMISEICAANTIGVAVTAQASGIIRIMA